MYSNYSNYSTEPITKGDSYRVASEQQQEISFKTHKFAMALGSAAFAGGIAYSFMKKTGFWKGWGISILFSIGGSALGAAIDYATIKK